VNHSHSREKGFGHRIQSDDLASNWINWRSREAQVGPTILLKSLLAQNHHSLHDFLDGVGVQNQGTAKGANSLGV
jgi:phage baseplate assembly protein gpV